MLIDSPQITGSINIQAGPSGSRPTANLASGSLYFNTDVLSLEIYTGVSGSEWQAVGSGSSTQTDAGGGSVADIEYLVVAGGGSGGSGGSSVTGGGGGAGGYLSSSLSSIESGSSITVTIGAGGAAKAGTSDLAGELGGDSSIASAGGTSFVTVTASGGGGGGGNNTNPDNGDGGSGAGGKESDGPGGSGTVGQGNDGGSGSETGNLAGGGGGAGEAGNTDGQGYGGDGSQSNITGTLTYYAGGGSSNNNTNQAGVGGQGGGGNAPSGDSAGDNGDVNTGGGGSGGYGDSVGASGAGGSGVVILAYPTASITAKGGIKTQRSDGNFVHTFNSSGTLTVGGSNTFPVAPVENFNTVIFTGNGTTQNITSVGFQSDFIWIKNRTDIVGHRIYDVTRGLGGTEEYLVSDTNAASVVAGTGGVTAVSSTGFTVGTGNAHNGNTDKIVAWCWKAGGATTTNNSGDVTATLSANPAAGFSVVKYNDGGTNQQTVAHGLDQAPELIITKEDTTADWIVYFTVTDGSMDFMRLNTTAAKSDSSLTIPTANYFYSRGSSSDIFNYCFHSVEGYQKIGTYVGTGTSGNSITTGFKPKFVLTKALSATGGWRMFDSVRGTDKSLRANIDGAEYDDTSNYYDFESTGFAFNVGNSGIANGDLNGNGVTYLYLAISE